MSYEELNVDNAIVKNNNYSPATKAFKTYDQK